MRHPQTQLGRIFKNSNLDSDTALYISILDEFNGKEITYFIYCPTWNKIIKNGWWTGSCISRDPKEKKIFKTSQEAYTDFIENYEEEE